MLDEVRIRTTFDTLLDGIAALVPVQFDRDAVTPETRVRDLASGGLGRAAMFHALVRFGMGTPEQLVAGIETIGEACEWLDVRWQNELPADLPVATSDLVYGPRVALRPVVDADLEAIYLAATHPDAGFRWRFKGQTPAPDEVVSTLWRGVQALFVVHRVGDDAPIGLVVAYQASLANGTVYVAFQRINAQRGYGEMFEAMFLFLEFLFRTWDFRKVYAEVPGYNIATVFGGDQTLFVEEGRLVAHERYAGVWWDFVTGALRREAWDDFAAQWRTWFCGNRPT